MPENNNSGKYHQRIVASIMNIAGVYFIPEKPLPGDELGALGSMQRADFLIPQLAGFSGQLYIECKRQAESGSAEEKICHSVQSAATRTWPTLFVFQGEYSGRMLSFVNNELSDKVLSGMTTGEFAEFIWKHRISKLEIRGKVVAHSRQLVLPGCKPIEL